MQNETNTFPVYLSMHTNFISENNPSRYPKFIESYSLEEYRKKWDSLPSGAREENEEIYVAGIINEIFNESSMIIGRIQNKRKASSKLIFYDIKSDDTTIQVFYSSKIRH